MGLTFASGQRNDAEIQAQYALAAFAVPPFPDPQCHLRLNARPAHHLADGFSLLSQRLF
jgi:hypothetical protein